MRLAFFRSDHGGVWDKLIAWWTDGPYSHVEMAFDEDSDAIAAQFPEMIYNQRTPGSVLCYSSHSAAPRKGTGFAWINFGANLRAWELVTVPATASQIQAAVDYAVKLGHVGYNWRGIAGFAIKDCPDDCDDRFCSQVCAELCQEAMHLLRGLLLNRTSPSMLYAVALNAFTQSVENVRN